MVVTLHLIAVWGCCHPGSSSPGQAGLLETLAGLDTSDPHCAFLSAEAWELLSQLQFERQGFRTGMFYDQRLVQCPPLGSEMTKLNSLSRPGKLFPGALCLSGVLPISFLSSTPPPPCFLLLHPTLLISLLYLFFLVLLIAFLKRPGSAFPLSRGWVRSDRPLAGAGGNTGCPAPPECGGLPAWADAASPALFSPEDEQLPR